MVPLKSGRFKDLKSHKCPGDMYGTFHTCQRPRVTVESEMVILYTPQKKRKAFKIQDGLQGQMIRYLGLGLVIYCW